MKRRSLVSVGIAALVGLVAGPVGAESGGDSSFHKVRWRLMERVKPEEQRIKIWFNANYCQGGQRPPRSRVEVDERRRAVKVTVWLRRYPMDPDVEACENALEFGVERVRIDDPIGARVLLDGSRPRGDRQVWPK